MPTRASAAVAGNAAVAADVALGLTAVGGIARRRGGEGAEAGALTIGWVGSGVTSGELLEGVAARDEAPLPPGEDAKDDEVSERGLAGHRGSAGWASWESGAPAV